jgi:glucosyl-3-phosphoglycerate synthase
MTLTELVELKRTTGRSVGVCLPALNEEATVGSICSVISRELVTAGLVDDLVLMDSGSTDRTQEVAEAAGARVFRAKDVLPERPHPSSPGKGESLWKSLAVVDTDIIVWVDSDTRNFSSSFVTSLVAPLLEDEKLVFAKAFYDRPLGAGDELLPMGGARVTEIGIRPLINLLVPELAGFVQPLSGEYAGRREALLDIPFGTGYDVDILMLLDLVTEHGLDAIAQVDLGTRVHRNRAIPSLGRMSFEIMRGLFGRLEEQGRIKLGEALSEKLVQFADSDGGREALTFESDNFERPPMRSILAG